MCRRPLPLPFLTNFPSLRSNLQQAKELLAVIVAYAPNVRAPYALLGLIAEEQENFMLVRSASAGPRRPMHVADVCGCGRDDGASGGTLPFL